MHADMGKPCDSQQDECIYADTVVINTLEESSPKEKYNKQVERKNGAKEKRKSASKVDCLDANDRQNASAKKSATDSGVLLPLPKSASCNSLNDLFMDDNTVTADINYLDKVSNLSSGSNHGSDEVSNMNACNTNAISRNRCSQGIHNSGASSVSEDTAWLSQRAPSGTLISVPSESSNSDLLVDYGMDHISNQANGLKVDINSGNGFDGLHEDEGMSSPEFGSIHTIKNVQDGSSKKKKKRKKSKTPNKNTDLVSDLEGINVESSVKNPMSSPEYEQNDTTPLADDFKECKSKKISGRKSKRKAINSSSEEKETAGSSKRNKNETVSADISEFNLPKRHLRIRKR
jgi:hypothetical protein